MLDWNQEAEKEENLRPRSNPLCCHQETYEGKVDRPQVELTELFMTSLQESLCP